MNPDSNRFETIIPAPETDAVRRQLEQALTLLRPNGQPVPSTWTQFQLGETVVIKNYTFKVAYIGETSILFEPVGPVLVGQEEK